MADSLKDRSITAFLWVIIDKLGSSVINFIVNIVLARLLVPEDFGLIAMVMIFFELSSVFIQSGFAFALIREKEISEIDKSTTFVFNFIVALFFYGLLFLTAPIIANFFEQAILVWIIRIMGINLVVESFAIIQHAVLTQKIDFKTQTKVRFVAVVSSGGIAIVLAVSGFGVWSLVGKIGIMTLVSTICLWIVSPWRLSLKFSWTSFRKLFGFGSKLLIEALIDKFFRQIVQVLIGKFFSVSILGFYHQANNFCNLAANNFQQAIQKVTYPVLAKLQGNQEKLKAAYRQILLMSTFIIVPVMIFMGIMAEPLLLFMIGEKWLPAVPFLQLLCIAGVTYHFNAINLDLLLVLGKVNLCVQLEVIKKFVFGIAILIGMQFGIYGLLVGQVIANYIAIFINTYYADKFLSYPLLEQLGDIFPGLLIAGVTSLTVYLSLHFCALGELAQLLIGTSIGSVIYLGLHYGMNTQEKQILNQLLLPKIVDFVYRPAATMFGRFFKS